jgi:hypothetical protein
VNYFRELLNGAYFYAPFFVFDVLAGAMLPSLLPLGVNHGGLLI